MKYPISKVPLSLFLSWDSKDGVKKPFRINGSLIENANKYETIESYIKDNGIEPEDVSIYRQLIFPITTVPFDVMEGRKTEATRDLISYHKLHFLKSSRKKRRYV